MGCGPSHDDRQLLTELHTQHTQIQLYIACAEGQVDAARLLLDKGADVNQAYKDGATPLHLACSRGHLDVARLLLEKGASVCACYNGETPLDVAKRRQHHRVVALLEEPRPLPLGPPRPQRQQSDVQCSICLGPYIERAWTKCNHSFCRKCIMQVCLTNYPTNRAPCPFCRRPVLLGEISSPSSPLRSRRRMLEIYRANLGLPPIEQ